MKDNIDQIKQAEVEAEIFLKLALALSKARPATMISEKLIAAG